VVAEGQSRLPGSGCWRQAGKKEELLPWFFLGEEKSGLTWGCSRWREKTAGGLVVVTVAGLLACVSRGSEIESEREGEKKWRDGFGFRKFRILKTFNEYYYTKSHRL
jgi:hypothetical protein